MLLSIKVQCLLFCLTITETLNVTNVCPSFERIKPCECTHSPLEEGLELTCEDVTTDSSLKHLLTAFTKQNITAFSLIDSNLQSLGTDYFKDHFTARKIEISNVKIWSNFSLFGTFHGMENTLLKIVFTDVYALVTKIESSDNFTSLQTFEMWDCAERPEHISENFTVPSHSYGNYPIVYHFNITAIIPHLPKFLSSITIRNCRLQYLPNYIFKRFTNLRKLDLSSNLMMSVKRNYLPRPAEYLSSLDLSDNLFTHLPNDAFIDMPALQEISLTDSSLSVLDADVFKPVFKQLKSFAVGDVRISCDCGAAWLLKNVDSWKHQSEFQCRHPNSLINRSLLTLTQTDLCMNCKEFLQKDAVYKQDKRSVDNKVLLVKNVAKKSKFYTTKRGAREIRKTTKFASEDCNQFLTSYVMKIRRPPYFKP